MNLAPDQQKCLDLLISSCASLGVAAPAEHLLPVAELIIQSMTGPWRSFHTPDHIFQVGHGGDAIEVISALFHDTVYVQVDQCINVNMARFIAPYIKESNQQLMISDEPSLSQDPIFKLTLCIFGFEQGKPLYPMAGQNEFLSALLAAKVLHGILPLHLLAEIVACIEATIPFRTHDADGVSCSDELYINLQKARQDFGFIWSDQEIHSIVERCVRLSNRDVENFSYEQASHFLDNTWNLIPETNHDLNRGNRYSVNNFRVSLQKMEGFLSFLKPELIFKKYHAEPPQAEFEGLISRAQRNLDIARLYLGMKLTSIAVLEAISLRIGKDVSVAMLMGELPVENDPATGLEHLLPAIAHPLLPQVEMELEVLSLLEVGRTVSSDYDIKNSPIATYMVKSLGFEAMNGLLAEARRFFKGELTSEAFLVACPEPLIAEIIESILRLFEHRRVVLLQD
jgi:hypothetical protein